MPVDGARRHIVSKAVALQDDFLDAGGIDAAVYGLVGITLLGQSVLKEKSKQRQGDDPCDKGHAFADAARIMFV